MTLFPLCIVAASIAAAPETWFHVIGANASKEGLSADVAAIADAGISGVQFFHGGWQDDGLWPGVGEGVACLSEKWIDFVRFASDEFRKRGLSFKMQNCPGWSMSGGPWIKPDTAMRKLVCFEPGKAPKFDADDDYREIGVVTFPLESSTDASVTVPNPQQIDHARAYEPDADIVFRDGERELLRVKCPRGAWQDEVGMTLRVPRRVADAHPKCRAESPTRPARELKAEWSDEPRLDMWEQKAGRAMRSFVMSADSTPVVPRGSRTLVFGHVNAKKRNHPAPREAVGWECDKMDPRGFEANFAGYLGKLLAAGVRIDGMLVDSWECGCQTWTPRMEDEFARIAGYPLRPWLPALFGYVLSSKADTERFLRDWRAACSRLVEDGYYGAMARTAHANGMTVQFESAMGDVVQGDVLRYWKYADEPMCEFWSPHDNVSFVGSHDFKPVLPCVSAAHVYGKRRVSAEALTSFELTFDENFRGWKRIIDRHLARGVTHIVFHTYTHNPAVGGKPPSTSFGRRIGSPFLRGQTWWPYMKHFSGYLERCCAELERGVPEVDILMYLGDDLNHRPSERELLFGNRYKYDYVNRDALETRADVKNGKIVFPGGLEYRAIWIPEGTYLLPGTQELLDGMARRGARVVRGAFEPDWPSPLESAIGVRAEDVDGWYQRRDAGTNVFFVASKDGTSLFHVVSPDGMRLVMDPVTGIESEFSAFECSRRKSALLKPCEISLKPTEEFPVWATRRIYARKVTVPKDVATCRLDLGEVRDWATVRVNGKKAAELWCSPYSCDIAPFAGADGTAEVEVEVVSTWYNALVHDASLPESDRATWTLCGPAARSPYHKAGLVGPVRLFTDIP